MLVTDGVDVPQAAAVKKARIDVALYGRYPIVGR